MPRHSHMQPRAEALVEALVALILKKKPAVVQPARVRSLEELGMKEVARGPNTPAGPSANKGLVIDVQGPERGGKSDFACSVAESFGPTVYLALDIKYPSPVKRAIRRGYSVTPIELFYDLPCPLPDSPKVKDFDKIINAIAGVCRPVMNRFQEVLLAALKSPKVGSVVIDNGTLLYKLLRLATFGYIHKVPMHLYAKTRARMEYLINKTRYSGKPVIWIHRQRAVYKDGVEGGKTVPKKIEGKWERAGFDDIGWEMQAVVRAFYDDEEMKFAVEVVNSTFSPLSMGEVLRGKNRTYEKLVELLRK